MTAWAAFEGAKAVEVIKVYQVGRYTPFCPKMLFFLFLK